MIVVSVLAVVSVLVIAAGLTGVLRRSTGDPSATATPGQDAEATAENAYSDRFVVTYSEGTPAANAIGSVEAYGTNIIDSLPAGDKQALTAAAGEISVEVESVTAHSLGTVGVVLSERLTPDQVEEFISALGAADGVEAVEPEVHMTTLDDNVPNDEYFSYQWDMTSGSHGINATNAWSQSTGEGVTVAVIDTGILAAHPDLEGRLLPGYDFVSDSWIARDNDGRDADPSDEGDNVEANACYQGSEATNSSWHGTHVAGIIAANANNRIGVAGVAPGAAIVPVRAMGRCGGAGTDIIDSITWASGGHVNGVPDNPNPARIINVSLGGDGTCPAYTQNAIDAAVERGSIIVAAAGNSDQDVSGVTPAGCKNVITVGSTSSSGSRASYSNYGAGVSVSAPGGDVASGGVLSAVDTSTTTPEGSGYALMVGTSQASPHVAGTVALLLAIDPSLTGDKATTLLQDTAAPVSDCDRDGCGSGIVDAAAATQRAKQDKGDTGGDAGAEPAPEPEPSPEPSDPIGRLLDSLRGVRSPTTETTE